MQWQEFAANFIPHFPDISVSSLTGWASLMASVVKNPPAVQERQETRIRSLGWENPLEEEMPTHSSVLAWEIPQTEELGGLQFWGCKRVGYDLVTKQQYIQ